MEGGRYVVRPKVHIETDLGLLKVLVASSTSQHSSKKDDGASRQIESGNGILDNNEVNFLMAFLMSTGGMLLASYVWKAPVPSVV